MLRFTSRASRRRRDQPVAAGRSRLKDVVASARLCRQPILSARLLRRLMDTRVKPRMTSYICVSSPQHAQLVALRESGGPSTPRPLGCSTDLSGILDRPPSRAMTIVYVARGSPYAAFAFFASSIARHTRSGVSGMSISVMPYSDSASIAALTMHTRLPAQPASPQPLAPSGFVFAGEG